jgi:DedD protein
MMRRTAGFGYGQIFLIIFGFLITSALIFLFGIWVGRDVAERRLVQEERVVRAPIQPPPTPNEEAKLDVDQSFYEQLKQKAYLRMQQTAAAASATAPPRSPSAGSGQPPTPTLGGVIADVPLPTPARGAASGVAPLPTPALGTTPRVVHAATPTRAATPPAAAPTRTAVRVVAKPTPKPRPAARVKTPEAAATEWADAGWTVQVNATTNIAQAIELARRLKAKGYDAYTVQAPLRGQTWYRVRVGRYPSRDKAKEMERRLKETERLDNAYVTPQ